MLGPLLQDLREMVTEQVRYRDLLVQMTKRDLLLRYKQSVMGFGWALFMPLVNTAIFSVIFTRAAPLATDVPYPLYAFSGLLVWNYTASSLKFAANSLTANANLVTKVYFPREIFPFSAVIVCAVDFAVASVALIGLMIYYGIGITPAIVALPVVFLVQTTFTAALALMLAMGNLFYRDVKYVWEIVLAVWMFASSVVYPVERLGGTLATVLALNPMTAIVEAWRDVLLRGQDPFTLPFVSAIGVTIVTFAASWVLFHRAEFLFAERI